MIVMMILTTFNTYKYYDLNVYDNNDDMNEW